MNVVLFENMRALSCRSKARSLLDIPLRANPLLLLTIIAAQGVHIGAMFVPGLNDALRIAPVSLSTWLTLLVVAATLLFFDEMAKWLHRALAGRSSGSAVESATASGNNTAR